MQLNTQIAESLKNELTECARREGISVSEVVRGAIRMYLDSSARTKGSGVVPSMPSAGPSVASTSLDGNYRPRPNERPISTWATARQSTVNALERQKAADELRSWQATYDRLAADPRLGGKVPDMVVNGLAAAKAKAIALLARQA